MFCSKCGNKLLDNAIFCDGCGVRLVEEKTKDQMREELVNAYIGNNADKLKSGFSFCSLFFGSIYMFYRKMWIYGILNIGCTIVSSIIISALVKDLTMHSIISNIITLSITIVFAIFFKKEYIKKVNERVNLILLNNQKKSYEELSREAVLNGGTTMVPVILFIIIISIGFLILVLTMLVLGSAIIEGFIDLITSLIQGPPAL